MFSDIFECPFIILSIINLVEGLAKKNLTNCFSFSTQHTWTDRHTPADILFLFHMSLEQGFSNFEL